MPTPTTPPVNIRAVLKTEFYRAIESGEKKAEYRACNPYWASRLVGRNIGSITFARGYSTGESMTFETPKIECVEFDPETGKIARRYALDKAPVFDGEKFQNALSTALDPLAPDWKFLKSRDGERFEIRVPYKKDDALADRICAALDGIVSANPGIEVLEQGIYPSYVSIEFRQIHAVFRIELGKRLK